MENGRRRPLIAVVTPSVSRLAGGLFHSVRATALALIERSVDVRVLTLRDEFTADDLPEWSPITPTAYPAVGPRALGYSGELCRSLTETSNSIVHLHGLWQLTSRSVYICSKKTSNPVVISPRGMLDSWALRNSAWKKSLALTLYERRNLQNASCIHALNESEAMAIRRVGLTNPIAIIPNGVHLPLRAQVLGRPTFLAGDNRKVLLFLGRIHPKKGIAETLEAWARLVHARSDIGDEWTLVVAGWDDDGSYLSVLKSRALKLGLSRSVYFTGPLFGEEKLAMLSNSSAFVLASRSEGLPMAVLEAWAHEVPVFMTEACNIPEGFQAGAALKISTNPIRMAEELFGYLNRPDLRAIGRAGRLLVENRFTWNQVADQLLDVYNWLRFGGSRPLTVEV